MTLSFTEYTPFVPLLYFGQAPGSNVYNVHRMLSDWVEGTTGGQSTQIDAVGTAVLGKITDGERGKGEATFDCKVSTNDKGSLVC